MVAPDFSGKQEPKGFFGRLFARKKGGTAVGKLWRSIANRYSGGVLNDLGIVNLGNDINSHLQ